MAIFTAFDINASGMSAQRLRSDVISQNLANVNSTSSQGGGAYRRKTVVFAEKNSINPQMKNHGNNKEMQGLRQRIAGIRILGSLEKQGRIQEYMQVM